MLHGFSTREPASVDFDYEQGDLSTTVLHSAALHGKQC